MYSKEIIKIKEIAKQSNKGNRFLKLLWLIPIIALGYIGWMNLVPLGDTIIYLIDVGGEDTDGNARVTGPFDRISDKKEARGTSFRELENNLVYFELESLRLRDADEVELRVRFKDAFPGDGKFIMGARNKEEWSYYWKESYVPFYERLANLPLVTEDGSSKVYATDEKNRVEFQSVNDFLQCPPLESVVAQNGKGLNVNQRISPDELGNISLDKLTTEDIFLVPSARNAGENGELQTGTSLRGPHTLYFFLRSDTIELKVSKRDLNGYEGADELEILVYSVDGQLKGEARIADDGNTTEGWELGKLQQETLRIGGLESGIYLLELKCGSDLIITGLEINQVKLVMAKRVFLAGNFYLRKEVRPMEVWVYLYKEGEIKFLTSHKASLQAVMVSGKDSSQTVDMEVVNTSYGTTNLNPGVYRITSTKGDIIIEAPDGYFAFTEDSVFLPASGLNRQENGSLVINTALRGGHTLWTYVINDSLELEVTKQDLNWYEKPDELAIEVYSLDGELKGTFIIPDDGDEGKGKELGPIQSKSLGIEELQPGAYRIELKGGWDLLIRKIEINQEKLVTNKVFLVGTNPAYFKGGLAFDPVKLYGRNFGRGWFKFRTPHKVGLQQIVIRGDDFDTKVDVNKVATEFSTSLKPGVYQLATPRQDIIIESSGYFSFTPYSFFLPKRCEVIDLKYDLSWVLENADYILVNYKDYLPPVEDDGWLLAQANWKREDLFIQDNKLSFCLNAPHLNKEPDRSVPVDWIEITLKTLPIWERIEWVDELLDWIDMMAKRLQFWRGVDG